ncbi:hypothetical protein IQ260_02120 [Leptolyngbya cf. ectocarpi LEGE 11479]|uniref:Uncharacterized protein n=1 Tax=Leptolyngbya cf. ectocarpi LEGE 11479 TaxID=1828722 RepID=A0A928ZTH1_LEPEC|nr:hypothetical protein [Leptolyngbya ectocarpi]MBE9065444.1 hypothetical protein [Leptolyngbya cf. ectocarpi LEGE 11479]
MVSFLKNFSRQRAAATGLLLAASVAILPACANSPSETTTPEDAAENVTTEEVASGVEGLIGETVSLRAEVSETVDETSFMLENDKFFGGEDILVINASGEPFVLTEGDDTPVQVSGEVQQFISTEFESEYGLGLDLDLYADFEERPVVVAQSIALSPDPGDITANPEAYYNQRIAVAGEVEEKLDGNTFTLDEEQLFGGDDLLVVSTMANPLTDDGERVAVTGVLRPYVKAEFETDYDLTWDATVQEKIEAEYIEKPVFVADEVYPSAK